MRPQEGRLVVEVDGVAKVQQERNKEDRQTDEERMRYVTM
jgi:hypothetical protein